MNIIIIGLGLIGGSLGMALKACSNEQFTVLGKDVSKAAIEQAINIGAIDKAASSLDIMSADLIILCTPVLQIENVVKDLLPYLRPGTILTDVGSTKKYLRKTLKQVLPQGTYYVGGHPMAGREKSGITAAQKDLFIGKWYFIIQDTELPKAVLERVSEVIQAIGANIAVMDVEAHDRLAAVSSHIPHIAAAGMVNMLNVSPNAQWSQFVGGGFHDTTRIASSNADMWSDICISNADNIIESLEQYCGLLQEVIIAVKAKDRTSLHKYFSEAKLLRDHLISGSRRSSVH